MAISTFPCFQQASPASPKGTCFDQNLTGCQSNCGYDSCDATKEATPCELTKFNYDGKYGFCYGEILM